MLIELFLQSETKKGIYILNFIESIKKLYNYAKYLLIGKTPILFFISILVWIFEISSYSLFAKSFNLKFNLFMIPEILSYRISNLSNFSNLQIILSCIIFLISIIVFFMNFINKFSKNKKEGESVSKKIYFIYDDIKRPSRIISGIIGNKKYSEVLYKKVRFIDRLKEILKEFKSFEIEFIDLKNQMEIESLKEKLLFQTNESEESVYINFLSSNVVIDKEKFFIFLEKSRYVNQVMADDKYSPKIMVFPNVNLYNEFLSKKLSNNIKNQDFLTKDEILPNDFKINLSELRDFLLFFSGSFEARYFNSLSSDKYTITKSSVDKVKMKKEHDFYYFLPHYMQKWMVMPYDYKETQERASYTMERLNIPDIALQWIHNSFNEESFENYLNKIFEFITTREKEIYLKKSLIKFLMICIIKK